MTAERIKNIREYIAQTAPARLPYEEIESHDATFRDALALADLIAETRLEGVSLAIEYGQALGLTLGRAEAQQSQATEKAAIATQIRDEFFITGSKQEAHRHIWEAIDKTWDQERAADLCIAIMKDLEETVKAEGGTLDGWDEVARITWAVKQAYCLGYCRGWGTTMEAQEQGFIKLFGADALGCKPGGFID